MTREGLDGRFGFYESIDYQPRRPASDAGAPADAGGPDIIRAFFAHHQGMALVALTNVLQDDIFVTRFHADPRVKATELLLQERVPREAILADPRPAEGASAARLIGTAVVRRFGTPHTTSPHTHFLSNGRYTAALTHAGGGSSTWRGLSVTRRREDRTSDAGAHFIYLGILGRAKSGRRPISRSVMNPMGLKPPSISRRAPSGAATAISRPCSRWWCRRKTTWKYGGCRSPTAASGRAKSR